MLNKSQSANQILIAMLKSWTVDNLPRLNAQAFNGSLSYTKMTTALNRHVLRHAPCP